jgi:hypothetical protein
VVTVAIIMPHKVHDRHNIIYNHGTIGGGQKDHKTEHISIESHKIILHVNELQGGYGHSGYMNDMQLGRPYVHYEGEGGHRKLSGHVFGEEASWVH